LSFSRVMLKELIFSISLVKAQKGLVSLSAGKVIDQDKPQLRGKEIVLINIPNQI